MEDAPVITIVLLGDSNCGKSTFLSNLRNGPNFQNNNNTAHLPTLRDLDQPFVYDVRLFRGLYRFEFYDTASPENYTLLNPDFVILCYDINNRASLNSIEHVWSKYVTKYYSIAKENLPIMLLGLKRDLRGGEDIIYPQEAYGIAQKLRCDRYAECSAVTGELMFHVFEDIARTAAKTTTERGGQSEGGCCVI